MLWVLSFKKDNVINPILDAMKATIELRVYSSTNSITNTMYFFRLQLMFSVPSMLF